MDEKKSDSQDFFWKSWLCMSAVCPGICIHMPLWSFMFSGTFSKQCYTWLILRFWAQDIMCNPCSSSPASLSPCILPHKAHQSDCCSLETILLHISGPLHQLFHLLHPPENTHWRPSKWFKIPILQSILQTHGVKGQHHVCFLCMLLRTVPGVNYMIKNAESRDYLVSATCQSSSQVLKKTDMYLIIRTSLWDS